MSFVDRLSDDHRSRLMVVGVQVTLVQGQVLLKRGERGGDLYLVEQGSLEIVDSRQHPEVVLDVLGPGTVVGEMAFMDGTARSADVRAVSETVCRRWSKADLQHFLERDADFASVFYRSLGESVVERVREQSRSSIGLGVSRLVQDDGPVSIAVSEKAREIADVARTAWFDAEQAARQSGGSNTALQRARDAFDLLVQATDSWISGMTSLARAREAGTALRKELKPYLVRSRLARLAIDHEQERSGGLAFQAHMLLNQPEGIDSLGTMLDEAFLGLPTAEGLRVRQRMAVDLVIEDLPQDRAGLLTLIQPGCGALLANLVPRLVNHGATVTCVDGDRETLAFVDSGQQARPSGVSLRLVHEDLVTLSEGRSRVHFQPQDIIIVDGLLDHLPERLAGSMLTWCASILAPKGSLVVTAMAPSSDARTMEHLLRWPLVRRRPLDLLALMQSAGLHGRVMEVGQGKDLPGITVRAHLSANGQV